MEIKNIIYINTKKDKKRREEMEEHIKRMGYEAHRIEAIEEGDRINEYKYKVISENRQTTKKEENIIASHTKAIIYGYEKGYESVLILEDDNMFIDRRIELNEIIKGAPIDWNIIKLHNSNKNTLYKDLEEIKKNKKIRYRRVKEGIEEYSAGSYIINRKGMEEYIKKYKKEKEYIFYDKNVAVSEAIIFNIKNVYIFKVPIIRTKDGEEGYSNSYMGVASNRIINNFIKNNREMYKEIMKEYLKNRN